MMDREERQHHARELLKNPLFDELLAKLEREAIDAVMSKMPDDQLAQMTGFAYVRACRTFRADCEAYARNTQTPKAAPA